MSHVKRVGKKSEKDVFPIQVLTPDSMLYDFSGHSHLVQDIHPNQIRAETIAFAIENVQDLEKSAREKTLQDARKYTEHFYIPSLYGRLEKVAHDFDTMRQFTIIHLRTFLQKARLPQSASDFLSNYFQHYTSNKGHNAQQRKKMISEEIDTWLNAFFTGHNTSPLEKWYGWAQSHFTPELLHKLQDSRSLRSEIFKEFAHLPEWIQVQACHSGIRFFIDYRPQGLIAQVHQKLGIMNVALSNVFSEKKEELLAAMREELVHSLTWDTQDTMTQDNMTVDEWSVWQKRCMLFQKYIKRLPPEAPIVQLIHKTEPGGGTLFFVNPALAPLEVLTDIIDAEIYLRTKEGKSSQETEKELRKLFSDEIYDGSRKFIHGWIDDAAQILTAKLGPVEAARYKAKWEQDPLCHNITLTHLHEYNLVEREAQRSGPS